MNDLKEIEDFAKETLAELTIKYPQLTGWTFKWDRTKRAVGRCFGAPTKEIRLSKNLIPAINDQSKIVDIILHEIAHALAGVGNGHNYVWQKWCHEIGAKTERCVDYDKYINREKIQFKYKDECSNCGNVTGHNRKWKLPRACVICCNEFSGGQYDDKFKLVTTQNY